MDTYILLSILAAIACSYVFLLRYRTSPETVSTPQPVTKPMEPVTEVKKKKVPRPKRKSASSTQPTKPQQRSSDDTRDDDSDAQDDLQAVADDGKLTDQLILLKNVRSSYS